MERKRRIVILPGESFEVDGAIIRVDACRLEGVVLDIDANDHIEILDEHPLDQENSSCSGS